MSAADSSGKSRSLPEFEDLPEFPGDSKEPYMQNTDDPVALMTYGELSDDARAWSHLRRNALTSTSGLQDEYSHEGEPLSNWSNHYHNPESWEKVKDMHDGDQFAVNMTLPARKNMLTEFKDYLEDDDETAVINPFDMIDLFRDKYKTSEHLDNNELPGIPSMLGDDFLESDYDDIVGELGDGGDHGYVVKPHNGSGGDGVEDFDDMEQVNNYLEELEDEASEDEDVPDYENMIVQPKVPHDSDLRVISVGDEIVNAERRYSPPDDLCTNLSQIDGELDGQDMGVYGKALKAFEQGRVEAINVDVNDDIPDDIYDAFAETNSSLLGSGARDLTHDIIDSFGPEEFGYDEDLDRKPFKIGMDFIETTKEDIQHLPEHVQERAMEYGDGDTVYLSPELNGNPGSMADLVAKWSSLEDQVTSLHVNNLMRDIAGVETQPVPEQVHDPGNEAWKNIEDWYPDRDSDYKQKAMENVKPKKKA